MEWGGNPIKIAVGCCAIQFYCLYRYVLQIHYIVILKKEQTTLHLVFFPTFVESKVLHLQPVFPVSFASVREVTFLVPY